MFDRGGADVILQSSHDAYRLHGKICQRFGSTVPPVFLMAEDLVSSHLPNGPASVGTSVPRLNAVAFVQGEAVYSADVIPANSLHMRVVRSTYPKARIVSVDTSLAEQTPGFVT